MPYTVHIQCPGCGRKYAYRSDEAPLVGDCDICQEERAVPNLGDHAHFAPVDKEIR